MFKSLKWTIIEWKESSKEMVCTRENRCVPVKQYVYAHITSHRIVSHHFQVPHYYIQSIIVGNFHLMRSWMGGIDSDGKKKTIQLIDCVDPWTIVWVSNEQSLATAFNNIPIGLLLRRAYNSTLLTFDSLSYFRCGVGGLHMPILNYNHLD